MNILEALTALDLGHIVKYGFDYLILDKTPKVKTKTHFIPKETLSIIYCYNAYYYIPWEPTQADIRSKDYQIYKPERRRNVLVKNPTETDPIIF